MYFSKGLLAAACVASTALAQTKLKFMPLGDSITEITCWRPIVWDNLKTAGLTSSVEFVGSSSTNTQNCKAKDTAWDKQHEGHSGYLAVDIAKTNLPGWLNRVTPDIVNFMLGTNDVVRGKTTKDVIDAYTSIVTQLRAKNPKVKIIVDLVIPLPLSQAGVTAINNAIPAWAEAQNKTESPIYIAETTQGYTSSMLRDGVHPNAAGDEIIAAKVTPILIKLINGALAERTT